MTDHLEPEAIFGIFTTDRDLRVRVWDSALARWTGVSAGAARNRQLQELFPEIESRNMLKYLQRVLATGTVEVLAPAFHRYLIPCPPHYPSPRFDRMLQRATIAPVIEDLKVVGILVTIEDVTTRVEREQELAERSSSADDESRLRSAESLSELDRMENGTLVGAVGDSRWRVRRAAVARLTKRSAPEAIAALLQLMRDDHRNLAVLNSALQVLSMAEIDTLSTLCEFLRDEDPDLRMQAVLALGEQRDQRSLPVLLEALQDTDPNVRFHAIEALGKLRAREAVPSLAAIAESQEFFLAFPAIEALKLIGEPGIAPRLVKLLDMAWLREPVAEALGVLADETAVAPLVQLLNAPDPPVLAVARALTSLHDRFEAKFGEGDYIADLCRQAITPRGAQRLLDELSRVDTTYLRSLALVVGWLRGSAIDQTLVRLLAEPSVRAEVVEALVRHGEGVIDLLIAQISSEDLETRRAAVVVLGRLGYKRATAALVHILKADWALRVEAANALAKIGDATALDPLLDLVGDSDSLVRQAVVAALNSIGSAEMAPRIKVLLRDERPLVRESAARIAGYFGYASCADLLIECSRDEDERVRRAAVSHLPFLDDERVFPALAEALREGTPRVRAAAATALGNMDHAQTAIDLERALSDRDPWVRYFAARSLGRLQQPQSAGALAEIVDHDRFNHVRIAAIEALGRLGGVRAVTAITPHLKSEDADVSRVATAALQEANSRTVG